MSLLAKAIHWALWNVVVVKWASKESKDFRNLNVKGIGKRVVGIPGSSYVMNENIDKLGDTNWI